jgi:hypothetical protein
MLCNLWSRCIIIKEPLHFFFYFEALYAVHFLGCNIYIRVQQLHYFIWDQTGYSTDVLQVHNEL